ncbi:ribonuclease III [Patescibacteria group bacterium]|nr:ribonuclease III [Patescibacteria group bacterium]MCL5091871.1 ribonuclease III [Patescibacteria group bacterium]
MPSTWSPLEKKIKIRFHDQQLLNNVFIHRSYLNEHRHYQFPSNEKLEFLGDSVLSLITSIYLYRNYVDLHEGEYTDIKAAIVRTESLAVAAAQLQLGKYLWLSHGEEQGDGRRNKNILADCFEALVAAVFLDQGFETAYDFVVRHLFAAKLKLIVTTNAYLSPKSRLQQNIQSRHKTLPLYRLMHETGPDHQKRFVIGVYLEEKLLARGTGHSKKEAEEDAAKNALEKIR